MSTNWQPISMLPLFTELGEKMCHDTSAKIKRMTDILTTKSVVTDKEIASIMHVLYRQRQIYPIILKQLDRWLKEAPAQPMLMQIEQCRVFQHDMMNLTQQAEKQVYPLLYQTREAKRTHITKGVAHIITSEPKADYQLTSEIIQQYDAARTNFKRMHAKMLTGGLNQDVVKRAATRLGIWQNPNGLKINTEHELNFFYDYCMYNTKVSGHSPVMISYTKYANEFDQTSQALFKQATQSYFGYFEIIKPVGEAGVIIYDVLTAKEHLMVDRGLNNIAHSQDAYILVSNVIDMIGFLMTTGASMPIKIHEPDALLLQRLVGQFAARKAVTEKDRKQFITDVFKLCFEEHLTENVTSNSVPHGKGALTEHLIDSGYLGTQIH